VTRQITADRQQKPAGRSSQALARSLHLIRKHATAAAGGRRSQDARRVIDTVLLKSRRRQIPMSYR